MASPAQSTLERRLGPLDGAAIIVSNVIGGTILFAPPFMAGLVPNPWLYLGPVGGGRRAGVCGRDGLRRTRGAAAEGRRRVCLSRRRVRTRRRVPHRLDVVCRRLLPARSPPTRSSSRSTSRDSFLASTTQTPIFTIPLPYVPLTVLDAHAGGRRSDLAAGADSHPRRRARARDDERPRRAQGHGVHALRAGGLRVWHRRVLQRRGDRRRGVDHQLAVRLHSR